MRQIRNQERKTFLYPPFSPGVKQQLDSNLNLRISSVVLYHYATADQLPLPNQGILKGKVSLYHWPPVWLVWNQLYDYWLTIFVCICKNRLIKTSQTRGQWYSDTSPFSFPWPNVKFNSIESFDKNIHFLSLEKWDR